MPKKEKLPEFLVAGEKARLIPVVSDGSREGRATSILLSVLASVHEYAEVMFGLVGKRIGSRSTIDVYTEVVFGSKAEKEKLRPDGLIIVNTGRSKWKALVEAKIGSAELSAEQIKDYLALAKKYKLDAVITVSNQYSAIPEHHPITFKKSDLKGVELYHFSWMTALTEAILLLKSMNVEDEDQQYILDEMVRYYGHPKVGVSSFENMNAEWKDVASQVRSGSSLSKTSKEVENTIVSWHQEARDLCLVLSRDLAVPVSLRLSRKHTNDPHARVKDDCEHLVSKKTLVCELDVPNAASSLTVCADLMTRSVNCCMTLEAPKDKQRGSARLNWLLRQLKDTPPEDIFIKASTMGRGNNPLVKLQDIRDNPNSILDHEGTSITPLSFDIVMSRDLAGKFSGRKTFITAIEDTVTEFYETAGQNLQAWAPSAPKVKKEPSEDVESLSAAPDEQENQIPAVQSAVKK